MAQRLNLLNPSQGTSKLLVVYHCLDVVAMVFCSVTALYSVCHFVMFSNRVTVTFNINNSIPPSVEEEPEQGTKPAENEVDYTNP